MREDGLRGETEQSEGTEKLKPKEQNRGETFEKKRRTETGGSLHRGEEGPFLTTWAPPLCFLSTATATPLVSNRQQRHRQPLTIFLPLLQHCEEEGKQQHWLAQALCRDSTISVPLHRPRSSATLSHLQRKKERKKRQRSRRQKREGEEPQKTQSRERAEPPYGIAIHCEHSHLATTIQHRHFATTPAASAAASSRQRRHSSR